MVFLVIYKDYLSNDIYYVCDMTYLFNIVTVKFI